jgi:hypothetical protein
MLPPLSRVQLSFLGVALRDRQDRQDKYVHAKDVVLIAPLGRSYEFESLRNMFSTVRLYTRARTKAQNQPIHDSSSFTGKISGVRCA